MNAHTHHLNASPQQQFEDMLAQARGLLRDLGDLGATEASATFNAAIELTIKPEESATIRTVPRAA